MRHYKHYFKELKNRTFLILYVWIISLTTCYNNKEIILLSFINLFEFKRMNQITSHYIYTGITELFSSYFSIIFFISNQIILIYLLYHMLKFISPGLQLNEYQYMKNYLKFLLSIEIILIFILNSLILPVSLEFFETFSNFNHQDSIPIFFEARIIEYIYYYKNMYYTVVLSFFFLFSSSNYSGIFSLNIKNLSSIRHYLYCLFIVVSTFSTPPDVFTQLTLSLLLIFFYEAQLFTHIYIEKFNKATN